MSKLRVGIIGLGMGRHHLKQFNSHEESTVVAVADPDAATLQSQAAENGIETQYADGFELIEKEDLDIVAVATPNKFHHPYTLAALRRGCHVFCEKPMAMNAAQAEEMLAAADETERRLMINFSFRFTPQAWVLKKEVDSGSLGDIYYARTMWMRRCGLPRFGGWFGQKALSGGGPLIDLGVHRLDLALWLMGYPEPEWVMAGTYDFLATERARREGKPYDVEDFATAMVRFKNGATLQLDASWASHIAEGELMETRVLGTRGGLVQRNVDAGYRFEAEIYTERDGCHYNMRPQEPIPGVTSPMHHFVNSIVSSEPHIATGAEGLTVMRLLDKIYESAERKRPVEVP